MPPPLSDTITKVMTVDANGDPVSGGGGGVGTVLQVRGTRSNAGSDTASGQGHLTVGGSDGTNLRPVLVETDGTLSHGAMRVFQNNAVTATGDLFGGWIDTAGTQSWETQIHNSGVACNITFNLEFSDDNGTTVINCNTIQPLSSNHTTSVNITMSTGYVLTAATAATASVISGAVHYGRWVRLRATVTSGSATARLHLKRSMPDMQKVFLTNTPTVTATPGAISTTSGPASSIRIVSTASTNAHNLKASLANLGACYGYNGTAAVVYLHLYPKNSTPVPGTDTPAVTIGIPANSPFSIDIANGGQRFATGLGIAMTTDAAGTNSPIGAGCVVNLTYA